MGSRVLSLWLPYLATDRIRRDRTGENRVEGPKAAFAKTASARVARVDANGAKDEGARIDDGHRLTSLCPLAERARLEPGMTLEVARERAPNLELFPEDREGDRSLLATIRTWCERYTPWAAIDSSCETFRGHGLWLDISSAAHHFGGEAHLLTDLLQRLRDQGLSAKAAIADHPGAAWAICRFGGEDQRILPANGARVALASLPAAALRLGDEAMTALSEQGMDCIEPLYALPRRGVEARFGREVARRLDQALGLIDEPIAANAPLPAQQAQLIFADPIMSGQGMAPSIERMVRQLAVGLEAAGLGVRRLALALYRVDGAAVTLSIGSPHPSRDVQDLSRRLAEQAAEIDPGFGVERAILDAAEIEPMLPETIAWRGLGTGDVLPMRDLAFGASECLGNACAGKEHRGGARRAGGDRAGRRHLAVQAAAGRAMEQPIWSEPGACGNLATALDLSAVAGEKPEAGEPSPKPLRLLRRPEPIEAIAPLPDEPPILFRWRQGLHKIVRAQGPERVAPDWWRIPDREQPTIGHELASRMREERRLRDYFAVEDSAGDRFWLFREGLYQTSQATLPRWYLHGLFR